MINQNASPVIQPNLPFDSLSQGKGQGKLYKNKDWLYQQYIIKENSLSEIGLMCKASQATIRNWLLKYNIELRSCKESKNTAKARARISTNAKENWVKHREKYNAIAEARKKRSRIIKNCKNCGKEFWAYKSKIGKQYFCNNKCRYEFMRGKNAPKPFSQIKHRCEICNKEFYVSNYTDKKGLGRFCSQSCMVKWRSKMWDGRTHPSYKPESHKKYECSYCGKTFETKIDKRSYKKHYCSRECKDKALIKNVTKKCLNCGEKVILRPFEIEIYKNMIFCSKKCRREYKLKNYLIFLTEKEKRSYLSKGRILKYCKICGKKFYMKPSDLKYNRGIYCSKICAYIGTKKRWENKEFAKRVLKAQRRGAEIRPTKPEKLFDEITHTNIYYTGNGEFWISFKNGRHKNPDFKVAGQRKVIEIFGDYWHKGENPQDLINLYKQTDFKCLIFWEHEIYNDLDNVLKRVDNFIST